MIERRPGLDLLSHLILLLGVSIVAFPLYLTFVASTQTAEQISRSIPMSMLPGSNFYESYRLALFGGETAMGGKVPAVWPMLQTSLISALVISIGKISISLLSAFALVYFRFPFRTLCFWMIFITLMLPVEVRISPTYEVVSNLGMLNTYAGLTIPLIASATATFLFRQFFMTVPDELVEAARMDGAGPMPSAAGPLAGVVAAGPVTAVAAAAGTAFAPAIPAAAVAGRATLAGRRAAAIAALVGLDGGAAERSALSAEIGTIAGHGGARFAASARHRPQVG